MVEKERDDMMMEGVQIVDVPVHWVNEGEKRLDAGFYAQDVITARILINKISDGCISIDRVEDLTKDIFHRTRFKRKYVSKKEGLPFLTPTDVFMFPLCPRKFIKDPPDGLRVSKDWILITCSGTVGRTIISNSEIAKCILSHDIIRVIPKSKEHLGFLYAYLNTWIGQAFLTKDQYGATVKHIEPHHVANIPIPRIPDLEEEINQKILQAHKLREEAQELLLKAEEMIYSELGLPKIDEDDVEYFGGEIGRLVKAFEVKASELDYRLDASYHVPILRLIKRALKEQENKGKFRLKKLGEIAKVFDLPTYKRIYVKPEEGYPILSGVQLRQIKPYDLKYISGRSFYKREKSIIDKYKIKGGWILTTERGTTGVSALVTKYWDGWLASHNILRVVPLNIDAGYLLAYLTTEYAQYQLKSKELGAVVEVLDPRDMGNILIPIPTDESIENKIGSLVIEAYNKKDRANQIEEEAITALEFYLMETAGGEEKI